MACSWARLCLSSRRWSRSATARRRISVWRTARARVPRRAPRRGGVPLWGGGTASQSVEGDVGELAAGQGPVCVVTVAEEGLEAVGLPSASGGQLVAGAQQHPQRLAVPVGARGR